MLVTEGNNFLGGKIAMSSVQANQTEFAKAPQSDARKVSRVLDGPPAPASAAFEHFTKKLTF